MARVLVYTSPARGHLFPVMDTALELARRGHDVHVRTLAGDVETVRSAGLSASPLDARIEARVLDDWQARTPVGGLRRAVQAWLDRAPFEVEDLRSAIAQHRPDLLLVDANAWGAQALAAAGSLPWATWQPYPLPVPSKDAPPFGPGFAPARGVLGRLRDRLVAPLAIRPLQSFLPALNRVRAQAGAAPLARIADLYRAPPLLLLMTAEPFEYPRSDWPANVRLVGPGLWSPPVTSSISLPSTALLSNRPVVLVTCSTEFQDDGALIDAALAAFGGDTTIQLVCTTGGVDPARFAASPDIVVARFLPHVAVLPRAAVVVCHGGMGITQRALASGVPVCVVPWGRDQLEVARRAVECGAGTSLPRGRLSPSNLGRAVDRARTLAPAAARVREAFALAGGARRAADLVGAMVAEATTAEATRAA